MIFVSTRRPLSATKKSHDSPLLDNLKQWGQHEPLSDTIDRDIISSLSSNSHPPDPNQTCAFRVFPIWSAESWVDCCCLFQEKKNTEMFVSKVARSSLWKVNWNQQRERLSEIFCDCVFNSDYRLHKMIEIGDKTRNFQKLNRIKSRLLWVGQKRAVSFELSLVAWELLGSYSEERERVPSWWERGEV